ncbi:hypothetical protein TanjilG_25021 [Lupinus angustifolius]|uniref:Uncharacterized protein n=1 Tax=Lupinus angustifolius TaxID=3871 RepID=A0A1J7G4F7_LUPAN|nr:hypothetical protein TanjilG_25021 [Lupinus angustifolius]
MKSESKKMMEEYGRDWRSEEDDGRDDEMRLEENGKVNREKGKVNREKGKVYTLLASLMCNSATGPI